MSLWHLWFLSCLWRFPQFQKFEDILLCFILDFLLSYFFSQSDWIFVCVCSVNSKTIFISERRANILHFVCLIHLFPTHFICQRYNYQSFQLYSESLFWTFFSVRLTFWPVSASILHYESPWRILLSGRRGQVLLIICLFSFPEDLASQLIRFH